MFEKLIEQQFKVTIKKEYYFHPKRKWRFDYAIPDLKIAIEIDGGVWMKGRHNRGAGFIKDMEKLNNAAILGWVVLRFTPEQKNKLDTFNQIESLINYRKNEENRNNSG